MINADTRLYAVLGQPVRHSKSPVIHNACFRHYGKNAVYLAFEPDSIKPAVDAARHLPIRGLSVTLPFKTRIMPFLDVIDNDADAIGAVNTVVNKNGILHGYNTDMRAAVAPIKKMGINGKTIVIVGAGGAAKAVAWGLFKENGRIIIVNRTADSGQKLAEKVKGRFVSLQSIEELKNIPIDILVNTTPLGMVPNIEELSFPAEYFNQQTTVMDIVYNPVRTKLLDLAEKKGCRIIDGISMFLYQAAAQFKLWTGIEPDMNIMKTALQSEMNL